MSSLVTFTLMTLLTNAQIDNPISCNGVVVRNEEYEYEAAVPAGVCHSYESTLESGSAILQCEGGSIVYKNYTDTDCVGEPEFTQDFCQHVQEGADDDDEITCQSFCDLEGCPYIKTTEYHVTECGAEEFPSEYTLTYEVAVIEGYCYQWDVEDEGVTYTNNGTHVFKTSYDSSDCSGDPVELTISGKLGSFCNETTLIHRVLVNDTVNASATTEPFMVSTTNEPMMISTTEMLMSTLDIFLSSIYDTMSMSTEPGKQTKPPKSPKS